MAGRNAALQQAVLADDSVAGRQRRGGEPGDRPGAGEELQRGPLQVEGQLSGSARARLGRGCRLVACGVAANTRASVTTRIGERQVLRALPPQIRSEAGRASQPYHTSGYRPASRGAAYSGLGPMPAISAATIRRTRSGRSGRPAGLVITRWWTAPIRVKARAWVSVPGAMRPSFSSASR